MKLSHAKSNDHLLNFSIIRNILKYQFQVDRLLDRLDNGSYSMLKLKNGI